MSRRRSSDTDACPGALRLHPAADGMLARVRLPGGMLSGDQLRSLRELAEEFGDGHLELTSRANLQLRGLQADDAPALADRLRAAGLLPSPTHDNVRNIAAPPLAGPHLRDLVGTLDRAIQDDAGLSRLPGKFLFAIGHVPLAADLAAVPARGSTSLTASEPASATLTPLTASEPSASTPLAVSEPAATPASVTVPAASAGLTSAARRAATAHDGTGGGLFVIRFGGHDTGVRVEFGQVVPVLIAAAHAFLAEREAQRGDGPAAWRLRELVDGPARVSARMVEALGSTTVPTATAGPRETATRSETSVRQETAAFETSGRSGTAARVETEVRPETAVPVDTVEPGDLIGLLAQDDGLAAVAALVPLGRLDGVQMRVLEQADRLVVTPWRGMVVPDLPPSAAEAWANRLASAALAVTPGSPWTGVTACAGRPGCAKSLADVRADATAAARFVDGLPIHWAGCARACGSPNGPHVLAEATPGGYLITRLPVTGDEPPMMVSPDAPTVGSSARVNERREVDGSALDGGLDRVGMSTGEAESHIIGEGRPDSHDIGNGRATSHDIDEGKAGPHTIGGGRARSHTTDDGETGPHSIGDGRVDSHSSGEGESGSDGIGDGRALLNGVGEGEVCAVGSGRRVLADVVALARRP